MGQAEYERFLDKYDRVERYMSWLGTSGVNRRDLTTMLARPAETTLSVESAASGVPPVRLTVGEVAVVEGTVKYRGYVRQQLKEVERLARDESRRIPAGFDYAAIAGLSGEIVEKLTQVRPPTLGQAARVSGVTPAAVALIRVLIQRTGAHASTRVPIAPAG